MAALKGTGECPGTKKKKLLWKKKPLHPNHLERRNEEEIEKVVKKLAPTRNEYRQGLLIERRARGKEERGF